MGKHCIRYSSAIDFNILARKLSKDQKIIILKMKKLKKKNQEDDEKENVFFIVEVYVVDINKYHNLFSR